MAQKLGESCQFEGRSKSYYIKKLSLILDPKFQDIQDMLSAKTLDDAKKSGEDFVSFDEVFKDVK